MLMPKKVKHRKVCRGRRTGWSKGARTIAFGEYGLMAIEPAWLTARQIESLRMTVGRRLKKIGEFFLRVFPDKPVSKKPLEVRMGGGKAAPEFWVSVVKRGRIIVEIGGVDLSIAREILRIASCKLPLETKFVKKGEEHLVFGGSVSSSQDV